MQDKVDRLNKKATAAEVKKLSVLLVAYEELLDAYSKDRTAANLKNWQAAEDALEQAVTALEAKYFAEDPNYPNLMAVVSFLQEEGYKIKKSKLYLDRDKGLIKVEPDGTIKSAEAIAYITRANLEKMADRTGKVEKLHADKAKKEMEKTEVQTEKYRFELEKEKGKYLKKTDVRMEFALKLGALESIFRNLIRTRAPDYIGNVGGNTKKTQLLVNLLYADLDEVMNQMCAIDELGIELKIDSGEVA